MELMSEERGVRIFHGLDAQGENVWYESRVQIIGRFVAVSVEQLDSMISAAAREEVINSALKQNRARLAAWFAVNDECDPVGEPFDVPLTTSEVMDDSMPGMDGKPMPTGQWVYIIATEQGYFPPPPKGSGD